MGPIYVIDLAAQHARWASARQAAITGNIANANTSGYTALDVEPFAATLADAATIGVARTSPRHLDAAGVAASEGGGFAVRNTEAPVSLDRELVKADDANRGFALDTTILRAFHRMMLAAVRPGA
jgi:flagellar basal-body rod protein FlgB